MASVPSGAAQMNSFSSSTPVAKGSMIEATASFDLSEFSDALTAQIDGRGY
jgi:hypothetical protein